MDICYKWKRQDCKQVLPRLKVLKERERERTSGGEIGSVWRVRSTGSGDLICCSKTLGYFKYNLSMREIGKSPPFY